MKWSYDWLYSCPAILVIGYYRLYGYRGIVTLPLVYPRINILGRNKVFKEYNSIPPYMFSEKIKKICYMIVHGEKPVNDFIEKALFTTMYYGGYNMLLEYNNEIIPLTIELVNTKKFFFYYKKLDKARPITRDVKTWLSLGAGLRIGSKELVFNACKDIGLIDKSNCYIETYDGLLIITMEKLRDKNYMRIVPDNNPLRHVINYDRISKNTM